MGSVSLREGEGEHVPGEGPVRTGVTAVVPHAGNPFRSKVVAAAHVFNGFGKSVGLPQIRELGLLETPILLTNTLNVGLVSDALVEYMLANDDGDDLIRSINPVVGECNDSRLNDIQGRHVRRKHVFAVLCDADDTVNEGAVGAGTGMTAFGFKGGIGTASKRIEGGEEEYVLGALVLANFGARDQLTVAGVPLGRELAGWKRDDQAEREGSVIIVMATDAPLNARQIGRVAKRTGLGLARTGSTMSHGSGDFVIAFSTAQTVPHGGDEAILDRRIANESSRLFNFLFRAAVEVTEESVINALFMAETTTGKDGEVVFGLPLNETRSILRRYGRMD